MNPHIDLNRHFRDLTKEELDEPELLAASNDHDFLPGITWTELLECPRVLLLAEAGSGKTREMQEKAKELTLSNRYGFFLAIEALHHEAPTNVLSAADEHRFNAWKADGQSSAWFFLDAVDELTLVQGKLESALRKFSKAIEGSMNRANVVLSCRPSDWRPNSDMAAFQTNLPVTPRSLGSSDDPEITALEAFLAPLREASKSNDPIPTESQTPEFRTVVLLPLSQAQIEKFAVAMNVVDATGFVAELKGQDAWDFARRPFDLLELIASWQNLGKLGTRREQHESNITAKLKENPDRLAQNILSSQEARTGAERLALALALTRTRTIRSSEQSSIGQLSDGMLDPRHVLTDWTDAKLRALLTCGLFDPATYERVRFHHRTVQEFLAAHRLHHLKSAGMSKKALFRLLFAEQYGAEVIFPSMRPIAAWLAHWDADARREVLKRDPEALMALADPESLPLSTKAAVLRAFAKRYVDSKEYGINIPLDGVRRFAHADLDGVIRELWGASGPTNDDLFELLIELIWKGKSAGCADIARSVAHNTTCHPVHRIYAVSSLVDSGSHLLAREVADSILNQPDKWPARVIWGVAADLYPKIVSVDELMVLVERTPEPKNTVGGFAWRLNEISRSIEPTSVSAVELRNQLTDLLIKGVNQPRHSEKLTSRYGHVAEPLVMLCTLQLKANDGCVDADLINACVVAHQFNSDQYGNPNNSDDLRREIASYLGLREAVFWKQLDMRDTYVKPDNNDDWNCYYFSLEDGLLTGLNASDVSWLESALKTTELPRQRGVALQALLHIECSTPLTEEYVSLLKAAVKDHQELMDVLLRHLESLATYQDQHEERQRERLERRLTEEKKQNEKESEWLIWREELVAFPAKAFQAEKLDFTLTSLFDWVELRHRKNGYSGSAWNQQALDKAFGAGVVSCLKGVFADFWRKQTPQLFSERPQEKQNERFWTDRCALCGLAAESETAGWASHLTAQEARLAIKFSCLELNDFSPWLVDLVIAKSNEVQNVLGSELTRQFASGSPKSHYIPLLQNLTHADIKIQQSLTSNCIELLLNWSYRSSESAADVEIENAAHHLDQLTRILNATVRGQDRQNIATFCQTKFSEEFDLVLVREWLRALFKFDFDLACETLTAKLLICTEADATSMLGFLFGDNRGIAMSPMSPMSSPARATTLGKLVKVVYKIVRPQDDRQREGIYTPNPRDLAQKARRTLLETLIETPGLATYQELHALVADDAFSEHPNRLLIYARKLAARDAEFTPYSPADLIAMDSQLEAPAHDRDSLFTLMLNRLEDLQNHFSHDQFSTRKVLQTITSEIDMQLQVASALKAKNNGAYLVSREPEVADRKKPDIQLAATRGDQKASIEIKLADGTALAKLEHALEHQLLGQYLRDANSKAGCLLITYSGKQKSWTRPNTKKRLDFSSMVAHLKKLAEGLEARMSGDVRLAVFGLDLRDPLLVPAHKPHSTLVKSAAKG